MNTPKSDSLPSGTVTFLFTDIASSTRLLQQLDEEYATLLADQRRLLRSAFENHGGREVDTQGDAFFASFPRASQAVAAAVEAQRALANHPWPQGVDLRVRMGLHTGEPLVAEEGYVGLDVHRAARIAQAGHGGQVLLSASTAALLASDLPDGVCLLDLGEYRLKDLRHPVRIHQLEIAGLPASFPALKSLDALPNNLPALLTSFVGRTEELSEVKALLSKARLVTLVGPGGTGKTRLSLQDAAELDLGNLDNALEVFHQGLNLALAFKYRHTALYALIGLASVQARQGDEPGAIELLVVAISDPITPAQYRIIGQMELDKIQDRISADVFAAARELGQQTGFDDVIARIRKPEIASSDSRVTELKI